MAWNNTFRPYGVTNSPSTDLMSLRTIYDYCDSFPVMELKCELASSAMGERPPMVPYNNFNTTNNMEKKKRLSLEQIECLEKSFQAQIKLDPDRKMKLAHSLGLQPRQVAVWFQNRRARWKAKQLERVYGALKQEFDIISREKQILQEEVMKLKAELEERTTKEGSTGHYQEPSAEETVESAVPSGGGAAAEATHRMKGISTSEWNYYLFNVEDYNLVSPPPPPPAYWGAWPSS